MDFGMPTLIELETLEENCALCRELGLGFVEVNMNFPQYQTGTFDAEHYRSLKEKYGIYFTVHLPEKLDVADVNPKISGAYLETVAETIAFARKIGCPVINMHMNHGIYVTLPDSKVFIYEKKSGFYMDCMKKFRDLCEKEIGDSGIRICIENTDGFKEFEKVAVDFLLESPVFDLTWDIGHSISADEADMEFLLGRKNRISHFHIHDGTRKSDGAKCHLELGSGKINLHGRLSLADGNGARCVLETKTVAALKNSVLWLKENFPAKVKIRLMEIGDYEAVHSLWLSCKGMGLNDVDDSKEGIGRYLERNPETCFVAEVGGRIAGVIMSGNDGRRGFIHHTAVSEEFRRMGIATSLVNEALSALSGLGISKVALVVFGRNADGNAFWEKQGFTVRDDLVYRNRALKNLVRTDT